MFQIIEGSSFKLNINLRQTNKKKTERATHYAIPVCQLKSWVGWAESLQPRTYFLNHK